METALSLHPHFFNINSVTMPKLTLNVFYQNHLKLSEWKVPGLSRFKVSVTLSIFILIDIHCYGMKLFSVSPKHATSQSTITSRNEDV